jgi:mRNA-degrading endonuclease RelE of RelBE toxin-antitoxin system
MALMRADPAPAPVEVVFTPEFKRNLRQLAKKYRQIKANLQPLLDELMQGQTPGDQIPGIQYAVFKVRVKNADSRKGKRGGYRIIYHRVTARLVVLVTLYSKTEQADITPREIRQIILDYEAQPADAAVRSEQTRVSHNTTVNDMDSNP